MAIDANIIRIDFRCVIKSVKVPNTTTLIMSFHQIQKQQRFEKVLERLKLFDNVHIKSLINVFEK